MTKSPHTKTDRLQQKQVSKFITVHAYINKERPQMI